MVRPMRDARRRPMSVGQLDIGDYVILLASVLMFFALVINWWASIGGASVNSVKYSQLYFVLVLILILGSLALIVYPGLQSEAGLKPLPFAIQPLLLTIGFIILLMTTYELGRYDSGIFSSIGAGFGVWLAFICCWVYLGGALIKWGSRERRLQR